VGIAAEATHDPMILIYVLGAVLIVRGVDPIAHALGAGIAARLRRKLEDHSALPQPAPDREPPTAAITREEQTDR
jgi:hypothetical protein